MTFSALQALARLEVEVPAQDRLRAVDGGTLLITRDGHNQRAVRWSYTYKINGSCANAPPQIGNWKPRFPQIPT